MMLRREIEREGWRWGGGAFPVFFSPSRPAALPVLSQMTGLLISCLAFRPALPAWFSEEHLITRCRLPS